MQIASVRAFLPVNTRRALRIHRAGVQLRLPLYLLGVTAGVGGLFAANAHAAYADLYAMLLSVAPESFSAEIAEQTRVFLGVSATLLFGWIVGITGICVAYTQALIGPTVALRRQLQALKRGDTTSRVWVRGGDPVFAGLSEDLNELTRRLSSAGPTLQRDTRSPASAA